MRFYLLVLLTGVLLMPIVTTLEVEGHHSASSFWHIDRTTVIEGVVKSVRMVNPHPEVIVEVTDSSGEKSDWYLSGSGNASAWIRSGWTDVTHFRPEWPSKLRATPRSGRVQRLYSLAETVSLTRMARRSRFESDLEPVQQLLR